MPHSSFNSRYSVSLHPTFRGEKGGRPQLVPWRSSSPLIAIFAVLTSACGGDGRPKIDYTPPAPVVQTNASTATNGAIFQAGSFAPLTSGARASRVGDIITIVLAERTSATKSNSASSDKSGSFGLTPPSTGPLALFSPSDTEVSGGLSFNGKGNASQSNALSGSITVSVTEILPNGVMRVRGQKLMTLNRGDERIQVSGLVRQADIGMDNKILSTQIADARIAYFGKGEIAQASKQGWLQRFFSAISPF